MGRKCEKTSARSCALFELCLLTFRNFRRLDFRAASSSVGCRGVASRARLKRRQSPSRRPLRRISEERSMTESNSDARRLAAVGDLRKCIEFAEEMGELEI